jgi:hypothetical protein
MCANHELLARTLLWPGATIVPYLPSMVFTLESCGKFVVIQSSWLSSLLFVVGR